MRDPAKERHDVLAHLKTAADLVARDIDASLIPLCDATLAYAISGARDKNDVAVVRLKLVDAKPQTIGCGEFGTDEHSCRIILTAMKFDPVMRSVAVIRFSKKILSVMEDMFLDCRMYAPPAEVTGNSSIDWGVASCCREGVPDIIYDGGELGKEVFIRIFGENPIDVANNIIICSNRILHMEL